MESNHQEVVPFSRSLPEELDEVLDGMIVPEQGGIYWETFRDYQRMRTVVKIVINDEWFDRTPRDRWDKLNKLLMQLKKIAAMP